MAECTAKAAQLAAGQWKSYVKTQLACGGGSLFKHISKQDKAHLNVDITDTGTVVDPDAFLCKQTSAWKELWCPDNVQQDILSVLLHHFRADAFLDANPR